MKALGTTNINFARGVVWQLYSACVYADKVDEDKLNYMFAIVTSFKPKDEVEAMVSVQFALTQTEMGRQACGYLNADLLHMATEGRLQAEQTFASNSCKFARTSIALIDALVRYRAGGDQKVTVQQNVLVSEGGRAIVGNLTQPERVTESPHVAPPPLTHSQVAPMPPVETAVRTAVPLVRKKRNGHARP